MAPKSVKILDLLKLDLHPTLTEDKICAWCQGYRCGLVEHCGENGVMKDGSSMHDQLRLIDEAEDQALRLLLPRSS
jgi:hypothetical protein